MSFGGVFLTVNEEDIASHIEGSLISVSTGVWLTRMKLANLNWFLSSKLIRVNPAAALHVP